jgi:hypothetical protein
MRLLAAADGDRRIRPVRLEKPFCTIDLIPIDAEGRVWRINIRISPEVSDDLVRHTPAGVELVDSDGEVWVSGKPNDSGVLVGFWRRDQDLWERLQRVSLAVRPR